MARGLPALAWHPVLEERALRWSFHMVRSGAFEHSSDAFRAHPAFQGTGENILAGYLDSADAHVGWMRSDGHRESILNADFDAVGIGVVCSADGRIWATQIFGVYASRRAPRPGVDTGPEPVTRQDAGISCHDVDPR